MSKAILFLGVFLLILGACSDNIPQIYEVQWQIILFQNRLLNSTYQKLSLFIRADDKDGASDLASIHLINDEAELYWTIPAEKWQKSNIKAQEWIGSNGIVMPDLSPFPFGSYRVVIEDLNGQTSETSIYIKRENITTASAQFPLVSFNSEAIQVGGNYNESELWIYDSNEQFKQSIALNKMSISLNELSAKDKSLEKGFTFYVYTKKQTQYFATLSGPYYLTIE